MTGSPAVNVLLVIAPMLMIGAVSAAPARDPSYLGAWARADGKTHIRVEPCGKSNISPAGASRWTGSAFDPQRNQRYTVSVHVANKRMTTHGCVVGGLVCQSMRWTRLDRRR
jgi:uncharacterized protein (DUF2147 family)